MAFFRRDCLVLGVRFKLGTAAAAVMVALGIAAGSPASASDVIRIASPFPTNTLDPMRSAAAGNVETFGQLYSRLLMRNAATGELMPGLAERWEISPDGLTYTFHLRDAAFCDGSPITADDVVFSLTRIQTDKRSAFAAPLSAMESAAAADPRTVTIKLKSKFQPFLDDLEIWNTGIVSKTDVGRRGEQTAFSKHPLTSGPYMVEAWRPGDRLVLKPDSHYWRKGFPKSDAEVELLEVDSPETRASMIKAGEVDVMREVQWSQLGDLKSAAAVEVRLEPSRTIYVVLLNHKKQPFAELAARRAVSQAIDRRNLTKAVTRGSGTVANTTLPAGIDFHDDSYPGIAFDAETAEKLLVSSGAEGHDIRLLMRTDAGQQQMSLYLQAQWTALGLKVGIVSVDAAGWWDAIGKGDYDATVASWYSETSDPDLGARWAVCGSCGSNSYSTFYQNARIDQLVDAGTVEVDRAKRAEIYKEIQRISTDDVAQIPLFYTPNVTAYSTRIRGLKLTPALQWTLEDVTIAK